MTFGLYWVLSKWYPIFYVFLTHFKSSFSEATLIYIISKVDHMETLCNVKYFNVSFEGPIRYFIYRKSCFIYSEEVNKFQQVSYDINKKNSQIHEMSKGRLEDPKSEFIYGKNDIEIQVKNIFILFFEEVLTPFYFFQIFSIIIWLIELYWIYALALFITSLISASISLYQTRKNLMNLKEMSRNKCTVCRITNGKRDFVTSTELIPGDMIEIDKNMVLPCDTILISGQCVMNESMLTGESIPVIKSELSNDEKTFSPTDNRSSILFSGTNVLDVKNGTTAYVFKTGFSTSKGKLLLSILYPKPNQFRFYTDSLKFVGVMFLLGICGMIYGMIMLSLAGASWFTRIIRMFDIITISVPPALPLAMSVGTSYAMYRLKNQNIFCISPPRVNVSGMIEYMCYDKTGTLTEDSLGLFGIYLSQNQSFIKLITEDEVSKEEIKKEYSIVSELLSSCHGLTILNDKLIGDPLEIKIFEATKDEIVDDFSYYIKHSTEQINILKRFEFTSSLQRMSVIAESSKIYLFSKGSPEMILKLSLKNSIPNDYEKVLNSYTKQGFRVLACGYKEILKEEKDQKREELETNLEFLGFIILQNKVKEQSAKVIKEMKEASIENIMITGDNPFTAISVARESGIIEKDSQIYLGTINEKDEILFKDTESDQTLDSTTLLPIDSNVKRYQLAITGPLFKHLIYGHSTIEPNILFYKVLKLCKIYSRMLPEQKMRLIEEYQNISKITGMVGDGCNDAPSLKTAHCGISLSSSEASIAAPFTSLNPTVECVPIVIKEGRCSLTTSFQMFKFICLYSFIQTISVLFLYNINAVLSDFQFLYVDLVIITPIALTMGRTGPKDTLDHDKPPVALFSVLTFISVFGILLISLIFQLFVWFDLKSQIWYIPFKPESGNITFSTIEVTTLFIINQFQTINVAFAFSIGKNFRKPIYTNCKFISY